jgi:glycosyltransferase involved in cell wall biosynthesis
VTIAAPAPTKLEEDGVHFQSLGPLGGSRWQRLGRGFRAMLLMLSARGVIVHLHDPELLVAAFIPSILGRKLIFDAHEFYVAQIRQATWLPWFFRHAVASLYDFIERIVLSRFAGVVVATNAMRDRYARMVGDNRVAVVRNFPYIDITERSQVLAEGHPLGGQPYIVHTGGTSSLRMFHVIVKAVESLREHECTWPFVNLGEIDLSGYHPGVRKDLERRAAAVGIRNLGVISQEQAWRYCAHATVGMIFLKPIENYMQALPIKLFEYWTFGVPVVACDLGLVANYIRQTGAGLLFPPEDGNAAAQCVLRLWREPALRARLAQAALAASDSYEFSSELVNLLALYEVIQTRDRRA